LSIYFTIEFDGLTSYFEKEVRRWINDLVIENNANDSLVQEQHIEISEIENEIFTSRVKEEIIVGPLWDYIKFWVNKVVVAITKVS
jgi:hypothetical protein